MWVHHKESLHPMCENTTPPKHHHGRLARFINPLPHHRGVGPRIAQAVLPRSARRWTWTSLGSWSGRWPRTSEAHPPKPRPRRRGRPRSPEDDPGVWKGEGGFNSKSMCKRLGDMKPVSAPQPGWKSSRGIWCWGGCHGGFCASWLEDLDVYVVTKGVYWICSSSRDFAEQYSLSSGSSTRLGGC